eukprot:1195234-Prorocentrum_minimum.AAC.2
MGARGNRPKKKNARTVGFADDGHHCLLVVVEVLKPGLRANDAQNQSQEGRRYIPSVRTNHRRGGGIYPA